MAKSSNNEFTPTFSQAIAADEGEVDIGAAVSALIADAVAVSTTDIHLDPGLETFTVKFRAEGVLQLACHVPRPLGESLLRALQVAAEIDTASSSGKSEGRFVATVGADEVALRVASVRAVQGRKLTVRILGGEHSRRTLDGIGMDPSCLRHASAWVGDPRGMVLVSGPTGMGKTTTAYALLAEIAERGNAVITLEDPVEMAVDGLTQIAIDPEREGAFADGLRHSMRLDPDVIFIGEVRSEEAAHAVVDASFSGHGVISTMHSRDPVGAVTVLRSFEIDDHEIAASLRMVVGQRLFRRLCSDCSEAHQPSAEQIKTLADSGLDAGCAETQWRRPGGCEKCVHTGFKGLRGAFDVWRLTDEDYHGILHHRDERELRATLRARSPASVTSHAVELAKAGELWLDDVPLG